MSSSWSLEAYIATISKQSWYSRNLGNDHGPAKYSPVLSLSPSNSILSSQSSSSPTRTTTFIYQKSKRKASASHHPHSGTTRSKEDSKEFNTKYCRLCHQIVWFGGESHDSLDVAQDLPIKSENKACCLRQVSLCIGVERIRRRRRNWKYDCFHLLLSKIAFILKIRADYENLKLVSWQRPP